LSDSSLALIESLSISTYKPFNPSFGTTFDASILKTALLVI
jgi:hypothetical protein